MEEKPERRKIPRPDYSHGIRTHILQERDTELRVATSLIGASPDFGANGAGGGVVARCFGGGVLSISLWRFLIVAGVAGLIEV